MVTPAVNKLLKFTPGLRSSARQPNVMGNSDIDIRDNFLDRYEDGEA